LKLNYLGYFQEKASNEIVFQKSSGEIISAFNTNCLDSSYFTVRYRYTSCFRPNAWWTVDGGGGTFHGEGYTLKATIGRSDANKRFSGEGYTLVSGFWVGPTIGGIDVLYLPIIARNFSAAPDLVIDSLMATNNAVTVTISNVGNAPVTDAFWVDVYFNPTATPQVNQPCDHTDDDANAAACVVWGIAETGDSNSPLNLPIEPGETRVLTLTDAYFGPDGSSPPPYPVGADVYGLVDSVDFSTNYGAVLERSEDNNLFGPVPSTAGTGETSGLVGQDASSPGDDLPARSQE
jgi:hypothetical protein